MKVEHKLIQEAIASVLEEACPGVQLTLNTRADEDVLDVKIYVQDVGIDKKIFCYAGAFELEDLANAPSAD